MGFVNQLVCHVDDISIVGPEYFLSEIKEHMNKKILIKDLNDLKIYVNIIVETDRAKQKIFLICEKVCEKWRRSGVGDLVR